MSNDLVIDVTPHEVSIALLEDKRLVELHKESSNLQFAVGDIYLAKVKKIMPGLNAAFVDVGYEKDAFLHYHDLGPQFDSLKKYLNEALVRKGKPTSFSKFRRLPDINKDGKIADVMSNGQVIMVQVAKEPISTKGPRLSSEISIAGRNMVLMPFYDKVSISQKIESAEERHRLKTLIQSIRPKNYGVIIRTAAEGKKVAELDAELRSLVKKWEHAFEKIKGSKPPRLVVGEINRASAIVRDNLDGNFNNIIVNDQTILEEVRDYIGEIAPEKKNIVKLFNGKVPLFEHFGINKQIKSSFGRTASFKNGAYLIIEHTEALHVIDVNSGNRSKSSSDQERNALDVNLSAADEIARQLRLRDMGGIIVIDFIDMHQHEHRAQVFERMKQAMQADKTKHNILPLSKFGLMQITRQRVRPEMHIATNEKCPSCQGTGTVNATLNYLETIENSIYQALNEYSLKFIRVETHPFIEAYINKGLFTSISKKWSKRFKCKIKATKLSSLNFLEHKLYTREGEEIMLGE